MISSPGFMTTQRQRLARRLRFLADRIDHHGAPRRTHWTFTYENGEGMRFREDARGCPLWYYGNDDYQRAHTEADSEHVQVDWVNATARRVGGPSVTDTQATQHSPATTTPTCPRCDSPQWVSVSLDGGYTRRAQCVPCGAYHPDVIGPGWKSPRFGGPDAEHPDYREAP